MPRLGRDEFSVSQAAKVLDISIKTLQRWDIKGFLKASRTPTNRRYYTREQLRQFLENNRRYYEGGKVRYERIR